MLLCLTFQIDKWVGGKTSVWWTGLLAEEGTVAFTWGSGKKSSLDISADSALWKSSEPTGDCGHAVVYASEFWDVSCGYTASPVCQRREKGAGGAKRRRRGGFFKRLLKG